MKYLKGTALDYDFTRIFIMVSSLRVCSGIRERKLTVGARFKDWNKCLSLIFKLRHFFLLRNFICFWILRSDIEFLLYFPWNKWSYHAISQQNWYFYFQFWQRNYQTEFYFFKWNTLYILAPFFVRLFTLWIYYRYSP